MKQYHAILQKVMDEGTDKEDRTGVGIRSLFGMQARYDLNEGFPLLTTKKTYWKGVVHELLWFLSGNTNIKYLQENKVRIWDEWADEQGNLGPVYGKQWRKWRSVKNDLPCPTIELVDQIENVIQQIKDNPNSRRLIVNAWNVGELDQMALPPCHMMFQFYVSNSKLSCMLYQRSADLFLGVPFNIASYSLLIHMIAQITGLGVGEFVHTLGDAHIYHNHFDQTKELLSRDPNKYALPRIKINPYVKDIDSFKYDDIELVGYESYPTIKAEVAV